MEEKKLVIIGAGAAGLCMGVQLKQAGITDFTILEKAPEPGGTWWYNNYPGAECDVQSHLYSFSFEPHSAWTRPYAGQAEILAYLQGIAENFELRPHIRCNTRVLNLEWRDDIACWNVFTDTGDEYRASVVISALGMFTVPVWPNISGLEKFQGEAFHSARWNHAYDLTNKKVAVIGSAASAVQFVPEIAPRVEQLHLFQRTPNWVVPKNNLDYSDAELAEFGANPARLQASREKIYQQWNALCTFQNRELLQRIEQAGMENISVVEDPDIRKKLTPSYPFGCKRPLFSDLFYPVFNRANVELVTEPIASIHEDALATTDAVVRKVDCIIYATGFETTTYLASIGVKGRGELSLEHAWHDGPQAYLGVSIAGFPNLFMLYGPNTNQGSILFMIEQQCDYIVRKISRMQEQGFAWMEVRPEVMEGFNEQLQKDIAAVAVWQANCGNDFYYRSASGRWVTQWPHSMEEYRVTIREPDDFCYAAG